jgi:hypothetical protein
VLGSVVVVEQQVCPIVNQQALSKFHERLLALGHDVCDEIGEYLVSFVKRQVWRGIEPGLYFGLYTRCFRYDIKLINA